MPPPGAVPNGSASTNGTSAGIAWTTGMCVGGDESLTRTHVHTRTRARRLRSHGSVEASAGTAGALPQRAALGGR